MNEFNWGKNFPFVLPGNDVAGMLVDACVVHRIRVALPLRVAWLYGFHRYFYDDPDLVIAGYNGVSGWPYLPTHLADIVIVDAADQVVFDSTMAASYYSRAFGSLFRIHEWYGDRSTCRIVQRTVVPPELADQFSYAESIEPIDGRLDERVSELEAPSILSLNGLTGNIRLEAGHNYKITSKTVVEGLRRKTYVTFDVEPGAGAGRASGCADADLVYTSLGGAQPDSVGNIRLFGEGCPTVVTAPFDWIQLRSVEDPALWDEAKASVQNTPIANCVNNIGATSCGGEQWYWFSDPCLAPCLPEHYVNLYKALRNVAAEYKAIGERMTVVHEDLVAMVEKYSSEKECRERGVVAVHAIPLGNGLFDVAAAVCNTTDHCLRDVETLVRMEAVNPPESGGSAACAPQIVPCTAFSLNTRAADGFPRPVTPQFVETQTNEVNGFEVTSIFMFSWDLLWPGAAGSVRFRVELPCAGPDTSLKVSSTAVSDGGDPVGGAAYESEATVADLQACEEE